MIDFTKNNITELREILKDLKRLKDMRFKLWKRWVVLFNNKLFWKKSYLVEYAPWLDKAYIEIKAQEVFKNVFNETPTPSEIEYVLKPSLIGGMKVYSDDMSVDLSFKKIEKILTK